MIARGRMLLGAAGVVLMLCVVAGARPVEAAWSGSEYATATVASTTMTAPTKNGCTIAILGLSVTFNWTNPSTGAPRTGYVFEIYQGSTLVGSAAPASAATSQSTSGLLSTLLGGITYDVRLRAANNLWRSAPVTGTFTTSLAGLITACSW